MKNRRIGKLYITDELVEEELFPKVLARMGFVPLRVEHLAYEGRFEYIGSSVFFDVLKRGYTTPTYDIIINDLDDDFSVSVKKI